MKLSFVSRIRFVKYSRIGFSREGRKLVDFNRLLMPNR